jgi:hypothetical protein
VEVIKSCFTAGQLEHRHSVGSRIIEPVATPTSQDAICRYTCYELLGKVSLSAGIRGSLAVRVASAAELGRRFFRAWGERGSRHAVRAALAHLEGRLRLLAGYRAGLVVRRSIPTDRRDTASAPTVSALLPTWNRATLLPRAIDSVLSQSFQDWELVVVDDGSTDETPKVLAGYAHDPRIRVFHYPHSGVGAARNAAFEKSRADIIAYLDSDNEWSPNYLETVVRAFRDDSRLQSTYSAVRRIAADGTAAVYFPPFDVARLQLQNYIDLNVFAHRRRLWHQYGGFDPSLPCLSDWDVIRRYVRPSPPRTIPTIGAHYYEGDWPRVTTMASAAYATYLIMRKEELPIGHGLKVLYCCRDLRELSQNNVESEIARMRRWGVEIEAWSGGGDRSVDAVTLPVHRGPLEKAIDAALPDVLHFSSLACFERYRSLLTKACPPVTLAAPDLLLDRPRAVPLCADPALAAIFVGPGQSAALSGSEILSPVAVAFDPRHYGPPQHPKDRRLVFRAATCSPDENVPQFLRLAKLLPEFRFVLSITAFSRSAARVAKLRQMNEQLGGAVDFRLGLATCDVGGLARKAAIYLHSCDPVGLSPGMPVALVEAMASGTYLLAQRPSLAQEQIGDTGRLFDGDQEGAALVRATLGWSDAAWEAAALRSIERAFARHVDSIALRPILDRWLALAGRPVRVSAWRHRRSPRCPRSCRQDE